MSRDEMDTGSLADQAAAWVPPWSRSRDDASAAGASSDPAAEEPPAEEPPAEESAPEEPPAEEPPAEDPPVAEDTAVPPGPEAAAGTTDADAGGTDPPPRSVDSGHLPGPSDEPEPAAHPVPAQPEAAEPPQIDDAELKGAVEAIILVVDEPVTEIMLAQIIEQPTERISATLAALAAEYDEQQRGFELRAVAGGWRLYTRTAFAPYVERFVLDGQQVRMTQAALETLAVIAYKQPVTRSRISAIRGVNCDGVVRTLLTRGLIEECGSEPDSGAYLYRTTTLFLEKLGLNSVEQLPPLAPFLPDDVEALADATG